MRLVLQNVLEAEIRCFDNEKMIHRGKIGKGLLCYVGFLIGDKKEILEKASEKVINLPLFEDDNGKLKLSLAKIKGDLLLVPNFTLAGRNHKGNGIDYLNSAKFGEAKEMFNRFFEILKARVDGKVERGVFGSYMQIYSIVNGPVNFVLDI